MEVAVARPRRWDAPFGEPLRDDELEQLLAAAPFDRIDPARFPTNLGPREILRNDARLVHARHGEVIVRQGDYGHSAFLILSGRVRVALSPLPAEAADRAPPRLGWLATLVHTLTRPRLPEVRSAASATATPGAPAGTVVGGDRRQPRMFLQDVPRVLDESRTAVLVEGEMFGELAALARSPRTATVFAEGDAVLLEIRWQGLRDLMRRTDALRQHVEQLYRDNSLRVHLRETPLLASMPAETLAAVADATRFESHGAFDWHEAYQAAPRRRPADAVLDEPLIVEEGTRCDGLILIRSGFARQSRRHGHGHRTIAYLGRGQAFGLGEALEAAAGARTVEWAASLRAVGYVDILRIPQQALDELVFPHLTAGSLRALGRPAYAQPPAAAHSSGPTVDQGLLEFLMDRRLVNGRQAMAIDLDRCTRCDDCVRACAATHENNPRFIRQGPRHGPLMVAQACMHCVDPVCMIGCPTGAIARDEATGVVRINDPTCIGCGVCAQSCPYDNIQMVEIRDARGALVVDADTQQPLAKATKCDLCSSLTGGPACQRACPHDALVRLDLGDLGKLAQWRAR